MQRHRQRRRIRLVALASRVDEAAGRINPFLVAIAVGLVVLDLLSLALLAPHLGIVRRVPQAMAGQPSAPPPRLGGLQ